MATLNAYEQSLIDNLNGRLNYINNDLQTAETEAEQYVIQLLGAGSKNKLVNLAAEIAGSGASSLEYMLNIEKSYIENTISNMDTYVEAGVRDDLAYRAAVTNAGIQLLAENALALEPDLKVVE